LICCRLLKLLSSWMMFSWLSQFFFCSRHQYNLNLRLDWLGQGCAQFAPVVWKETLVNTRFEYNHLIGCMVPLKPSSVPKLLVLLDRRVQYPPRVQFALGRDDSSSTSGSNRQYGITQPAVWYHSTHRRYRNYFCYLIACVLYPPRVQICAWSR
jgi:hypothetical protein